MSYLNECWCTDDDHILRYFHIQLRFPSQSQTHSLISNNDTVLVFYISTCVVLVVISTVHLVCPWNCFQNGMLLCWNQWSISSLSMPVAHCYPHRHSHWLTPTWTENRFITESQKHPGIHTCRCSITTDTGVVHIISTQPLSTLILLVTICTEVKSSQDVQHSSVLAKKVLWLHF